MQHIPNKTISELNDNIIFRFFSVTDLLVEPMNIAIPPFLIGQNDEGQLQFSLYVQFSDGFLAKEYLEIAIEVSMHYFYELTCNSDKNNFSTNLKSLFAYYSWESSSTQKLFSGCLPRQHHQYPQLKLRPLQKSLRSLQHLLLLLLLLLQTSKPLLSCLSQQHHP